MLHLLVTLQVLTGTTKQRLATRAGSDEGATAVEYALMVALIAVAIIGTVAALGGKLNSVFSQVGSSI